MHPFFPGELTQTRLFAKLAVGNQLINFQKAIMNTFVLFFFSIKLVVLARRVKQRMYAPGGSGFKAANVDFLRATKRQRL